MLCKHWNWTKEKKRSEISLFIHFSFSSCLSVWGSQFHRIFTTSQALFSQRTSTSIFKLNNLTMNRKFLPSISGQTNFPSNLLFEWWINFVLVMSYWTNIFQSRSITPKRGTNTSRTWKKKQEALSWAASWNNAPEMRESRTNIFILFIIRKKLSRQ